MAIAHRVSGTPTPERSDRVGRKRDGIPWHSPLTQVVKGALYRVFGWLELPAGYRYTTEQRPVQEKQGGLQCPGGPHDEYEPVDEDQHQGHAEHPEAGGAERGQVGHQRAASGGVPASRSQTNVVTTRVSPPGGGAVRSWSASASSWAQACASASRTASQISCRA